MLRDAEARRQGEETIGQNPDRILLFSRYVLPGQAKTRLIPAVGAERAAALQVLMTRQAVKLAKDFSRGRACGVEVRFAGGDIDKMAQQVGFDACYRSQEGGDLGERLQQAAACAFEEGTRRLLVIGTDCPELQAGDLQSAFIALSHCDVVLGPARDGGYYLIGLKTPCARLFESIAWGTELVLEQTLARAKECRLRVIQLPLRSDVDCPEDLVICRRLAHGFSEILPTMKPGLLSIIIPTRNEESHIERTLSPLKPLPDVEIIVADGGSQDATVETARNMGVRVLETQSGRGRQMNAAAAQASGEVLLFLHADTVLPADFQRHVWEILAQGAIAGAFRLRLDDRGALLRLVEWGANLRSRFRQMPYGDQAIFLKAETFFELGGFQNWPLMEDYEFCRRLRRTGRIQIATVPVTTSARRWKQRGLIRTTLFNQLTIAAYCLGVSPETLARWYAARKRSARKKLTSDTKEPRTQ
jgi:rSAM/selenodomain-associated transferase 2/rSAM/selenodomain-associated transferase 1